MAIPSVISLRSMFLAACIGSVVVAAHAAEVPQPGSTRSAVTAAQKAPLRKARVAQGGGVELVASTLSDTELAAMRPDYERLKPRVRSNAE